MKEWREDAGTDQGMRVARGERCRWNGEMDRRTGGFAWRERCDEPCEGRRCVRGWEQQALSASLDDPTCAAVDAKLLCLDVR